MAVIEEHIKVEVDKAAEEAGAIKRKEVFGHFGAKVGAESGLKAGRKAALDIAKKFVAEIAVFESLFAGIAEIAVFESLFAGGWFLHLW